MYYLEELECLASTRSRNKKISILGSCSHLLRDILYHTYHPLRHYHLRQLPYKGLGAETLASTADIWVSILERLENGSLSGDAAKATVKGFIATLTAAEGEVFVKILKKDLRCGISATTINLAIPDFIPVFGAMLAKSHDGIITEPMYMSLKLDGLRAIYQNSKLYTRNGHEINGVGHICEALRLARIESVDGELMIPGVDFQTGSGQIRSHKPSPDAVLHVFDTPICPLPFNKRLEELLWMQDAFKGMKNPCVKFVKHVIVRSQKRVDETFAKAMAGGYEGLVLKTKDHLYQTKRSGDWRKIKAIADTDVKTIGFFEGQGKYEGSLGGIIVDYKGVEVRVGGGFSDEERGHIWNNQDEFLGLTAEVLYHEVTPDGSLRHPRLKTFRYDK